MQVTVGLHDILGQLADDGFLTNDQVAEAVRANRDQQIAIESDTDVNDRLYEANSDMMIKVLEERGDYAGSFDTEPFGEALAYARSGDLVLAGAMAARAFGPEHDLRPIERALAF